MKIPEHIFNSLTDEQKKKAEAARTPEEFLALAKECGQELTADQLSAIAGGDDHWCVNDGPCRAYFEAK